MSVIDIADKLFKGEITITEHHPLFMAGEVAPVTENVAFVPSFANVSVLRTADGFFMVDTGSSVFAQNVQNLIHEWTKDRLNTAVYSHGHIDHVFGYTVWEKFAQDNNLEPPKFVSHEKVVDRFDRYKLTNGYNTVINQRQFQFLNFVFPSEFRYPDVTYRDTLDLTVGDAELVLNHAKGETDDHTYTWFEKERVLFCGDLFIWASPNAGNPQKVQRYPMEWAKALRNMLNLKGGPPEVVLPGHGFPIIGKDRVVAALSDTAAYLESIVAQSLELMNKGVKLNDIVHAVKPPADLSDKPYLKPVYDEPEFIVRNIWRLYGGWWDLDPSNLKPAKDRQVAGELVALIGGMDPLLNRVKQILDNAKTQNIDGRPSNEDSIDDDLRVASKLIEVAYNSDLDNLKVHDLRSEFYSVMSERATSTMSKGVYAAASNDSKLKLQG
jgi:glyoxylase-like metal-dependent hydrolase (beta-lactamase superfamily II)